jgi:hypothetical protein
MTAFGTRHRYDAVVNLQVTGSLRGVMAEIQSIFRQHCMRTLLASQQQTAPESANVSYRVLLRDPSRSEELRAALEQSSGVGSVSLFLREDESEI